MVNTIGVRDDVGDGILTSPCPLRGDARGRHGRERSR
jgi:hypothetical protein